MAALVKSHHEKRRPLTTEEKQQQENAKTQVKEKTQKMGYCEIQLLSANKALNDFFAKMQTQTQPMSGGGMGNTDSSSDTLERLVSDATIRTFREV